MIRYDRIGKMILGLVNLISCFKKTYIDILITKSKYTINTQTINNK